MGYEPRCKACNSPNKEIYNELYKKGVKDILLVTKAQELGESISVNSFYRHRKHIDPYGLRSNSTIQEIVDSRLEAAAKLADEIYSNIDQARQVSTTLIQMAQKGDPDAARAAATMMREVRESLESARKLKKELNIKPSESKEAIVNELINILKEYDPGSIGRLVSKLNGGSIPAVPVDTGSSQESTV